MLKINVVCVGKIKENYFTEAICEYQKRLSKFCKLNIIEIDEALQQGNNPKDIQKVKNTEAQSIIAKLQGYIICLEPNGKLVSSEDMATNLNELALTNSTISFVIGGSNGIGDDVLKMANSCVSFGKITFPHQLFRVVLLEQIYRGFMINQGATYHK
ncbi:MAG: 23S rRNA (pseudouridine(1915)-N(3))-methyltransferase RlmH [Clostridia bacterium]